jgi:GNAT superfamily N-acetyltransferase
MTLDSLGIRLLRRDEIEALSTAIGEELPKPQLENRWREQEMGFRELFAAELDGELVGTISLREVDSAPRSMHLFALEVAPRLRNQGIGGALVAFVLEQARERLCRRVYLEVRIDNPARRLYHRMGFRRVGGQFVNAWWQFDELGARSRIEEPSYRMVRRVGVTRQRASRARASQAEPAPTH